MFQSRKYQDNFVEDIYRALFKYRTVVGVMPTGGGKTRCFTRIIAEHQGASAVIAHRKEIVSQISQSLAKVGVKHRVIGADVTEALIRQEHIQKFGKSFIDPRACCGVASVQTLTSKRSLANRDLLAWVKASSLCVLDEAHHYVQKGQWGQVLDLFGHAKVAGFTATPERADGQGLGLEHGGFAQTMVNGPGTRWLIDHSYLAQYKYFCPESDLITEGVPLTPSGEINTRIMRQRITDSHIVGDLLTHYLKYAAGKKTIIFANDVVTAKEIARRFCEGGIEAVSLDGTTDPRVRSRELNRFENGELNILVNVDLFDEGFDVPGVEAVILARRTMSLAKYLQMIGRALRYLVGKTAIIIDPVRNWEIHGRFDWDRQWTLESRVVVRERLPVTYCGMCSQLYERFYKACPYCGFEEPKAIRLATAASKIEAVDGDLVELDDATMAAFFAKMEDANMSDEEYAIDQARRGIPEIGRSRDLRRHQAAKTRRKVLHELVAWWFGSQPSGRSLSEKHRRFYYRFGIDIATAMTLNAKDTDTLIDKIAGKFDHDLR